MQMCPNCDNVYDSSEYSKCPYCSGKLKRHSNKKYKNCPNCGGVMSWDDYWLCSNCGNEIDTDENDNDGIM